MAEIQNLKRLKEYRGYILHLNSPVQEYVYNGTEVGSAGDHAPDRRKT